MESILRDDEAWQDWRAPRYGYLHREDGPATVQKASGIEDWYLFGMYMMERQHAAATILLEDDGRGFGLVYVEGETHPYWAGCRRFTLDQALVNWSNPEHPHPECAAKLLQAVQRHATAGAA